MDVVHGRYVDALARSLRRGGGHGFIDGRALGVGCLEDGKGPLAESFWSKRHPDTQGPYL